MNASALQVGGRYFHPDMIRIQRFTCTKIDEAVPGKSYASVQGYIVDQQGVQTQVIGVLYYADWEPLGQKDLL